MKNRVFLVTLCFFFLLCSTFCLSAYADVSLTEAQILSHANNVIGTSYTKGYCLEWLATKFWQALGAPYSSACCAYAHGNSHIVSTNRNNIPIGANVYFNGSSSSHVGNLGTTHNCGHIGVYIGNDRIVSLVHYKEDPSGTAYVRNNSISDWISWGYSYRGWGYPDGVTIVPDSPSDNLKFTGVVYPKTFKINTSSGWWLQGGTLSSNKTLTSLKSEILNSSGGAVSSYTHSISGYSYSIKSIDNGASENGVKFSKITSSGNYTWRLTATDSGGRTLVMDMPFTAVSSGSTSTATMSKEYASAVSVTGVSINLNSVALWEGETTTVTATITPSNATNQGITWTSSNSAIATVTPVSGNAKQATIKAVKAGTATITCKTSDGSKTATCAVTVKKHATGINLSSTNLTLKVGGTSTLTASVLPSDATNKTVHWTSKNTSIATVTNGVVKGVAAGNTTITAMAEDGGYTKECTVTVVVPVSSISLNKTNLSLVKGNTASLTATVNPSNATNKKVNWTSSNTAVATVNSSGTVSAVGYGSTTITCTAADGYGAKASCAVDIIGTCGKDLTWRIDNNILTISGTGDMSDYTKDNQPWRDYQASITKIDIKSGVTSVGQYAFYNMLAAKEIAIPGTVKAIKYRAFLYCRSITQVTIPEGVESIAFDAFAGCTKLQNILFPDSLKDLGGMAFQGAPVSRINLGSGLTSIGGNPFCCCGNLSSFEVKSGAEFKVVNNALYSIDGKRMIAYPFAQTATSYSVPAGTEVFADYCFYGNQYLRDIVIPEGVTTIGRYVFLNDSALTKITIPRTVTSIAADAFEGCGKVVIYCEDQSFAHSFATEHSIPYEENLTPDHDLVHHEAKAPTCTEAGWNEYDTCSQCDYTTYVEIPALGHSWGEPTYEWAVDNSAVTAMRMCSRDDSHVETETVNTTAEQTKAPTYTEKGETTYTATFTNAAFKAQAKVIEVPMLEKDDAVKAVEAAINALPDNAGVSDKAAVEAARAAYDALTEDQKKLISADVLTKLTTAETQVKTAEEEAAKKAAEEEADAKKQADDAAAAQAVIDAINALSGNAGVGDKAAVEAARAAYESLTVDQKKLVSADVLTRLTTAETQVKAAEEAQQAEEEAARKAADDATAAQAVIDAINALPAEAGKGDKADVEAARAAYEALTEDQKALISADVLTKLTTAEAQVKAAEEQSKKVKISDCTITVKDLTYTGKTLKPKVTVKDGKKTLKEGTHYTLSYSKKIKAIGAWTVTVKGKGKYTGSIKMNFKVNPKGTAFTKLTGGKQQITLKWKNPKKITGYQIEYSLKKSFSGGKKVTIDNAKALTTTIKKLKGGKTYYVRIRTYTTVNKKNYYSAWSAAKTVKTTGTGKNTREPEEQAFEITMNVGEELDLKAILSNGAPVEDWITSDAGIAMVSQNGVVTALQPGEAVVTAILENGGQIEFAITVKADGIILFDLGEGDLMIDLDEDVFGDNMDIETNFEIEEIEN